MLAFMFSKLYFPYYTRTFRVTQTVAGTESRAELIGRLGKGRKTPQTVTKATAGVHLKRRSVRLGRMKVRSVSRVKSVRLLGEKGKPNRRHGRKTRFGFAFQTNPVGNSRREGGAVFGSGRRRVIKRAYIRAPKDIVPPLLSSHDNRLYLAIVSSSV